MTRLPSARSLEVRSAMPRSMCASSRNVFGRRSGIRTRTPVRAHPFEGCMAAVSSSGGDSPCLLVEGADCAGVCLAVLAWLCPGPSRDARPRVALMFTYPRMWEDGALVVLSAACESAPRLSVRGGTVTLSTLWLRRYYLVCA